MGMYTELYLGLQFKSDLPEDFENALGCVVEGQPLASPPEHPFFSTDRGEWCIRSGGSYYFDAKPVRSLQWDEITRAWHLTFVTNVKNYANEWQKFLDWIAPHIGGEHEGEDLHIGHYRYEENPYPTLLMLRDGKVLWVKTGPAA